MTPPGEEMVVLLDDGGRPCGVRRKAEVHGRDTPLHLAFSCWVLDGWDRVLVTRRAAGKRTWPAVWSNAFCGHPAPGEAIDEAVRRRAAQELSISAAAPVPVLPHFRYRAVMADGTVENEICPVYLLHVNEPQIDPDPAEVCDYLWTTPGQLVDRVALEPDAYSPWLKLQLPQLLAEGSLPHGRD